tara:strand:+ start:131 stop:910 length:780 start_codon:yes stop_codon:yes gene_type:complete
MKNLFILFLTMSLFKGHAALKPLAVGSTTFYEGTSEEVIANFKSRTSGKTIITFIGYSGRGYEKKAQMLGQARSLLKILNPKETIINIGVTPEGIGQIYPLAKELGFTTFGIVSSQAKPYLESVQNVDIPYVVQDETWGGLINRGGKTSLSPTSQALVDVSSRIIAYGAGQIGLDELNEALKQGIKINAYQYEENHEKAKQKALKTGKSAPKIFHLPAYYKFVKRVNFNLKRRKTRSLLAARQSSHSQREASDTKKAKR